MKETKESKVLVAKIKATKVLVIDISGLDKQRARAALAQIEGRFQIDSLIIRDMIEKDHVPFVYFSNGHTTYSHGLCAGFVTIYEEKYELV